MQAPLRAGGRLPFEQLTTPYGRQYLRQWRQTAAVVAPSLAVAGLTLSHQLRAGRLPALVAFPPVRVALRAWAAACAAALSVPLVKTQTLTLTLAQTPTPTQAKLDLYVDEWV